MEAALKEQSRQAGFDRRRDMEIFGLLKPEPIESSGGGTAVNPEDFRDFELRPGTRPESPPRWM
jgi:hypothetical protein